MNFVKSNLKELFSFLLILMGFFLVGKIATWIDPTSALIDLGWLQVLVGAVLKATIGLLAMWLLLEAGFPTFRDYANKGQFRKDFEDLAPFARVAAFLCVVVSLLLFLAVCLSAA